MLVCSLALLLAGRGFSTGGGPAEKGGQSCDAVNICSSGTCPAGMEKVAPPERSDVYQIHAANAAASYTPGETVSIWITVQRKLIRTRVNNGQFACRCPGVAPVGSRLSIGCGVQTFAGKLRKFVLDTTGESSLLCDVPMMESAKYIGLLLYAVDGSETKVGSWEIPERTPPTWWMPPDSLCGGKALLHASAKHKRYVHELVFRAPPAGAGTLTFRALIKHGDTNMGSFYWPVAPASGVRKMDTPADRSPGGDLTLTEATSVGAQAWFRATAPGQSCDDICAANGGTVCDLAALQAAADSPAAVRSATERFYTGAHPAVAACSKALPAMSATGEGYIFFHKTTSSNNTCAADALTAPSCSVAPAAGGFDLRRLCPCKPSRRRLGAVRRAAKETHAARSSTSSTDKSSGCPQYRPRTRDGAAAQSAPSNAAFMAQTAVLPITLALQVGVLVSLGVSSQAVVSLITLQLLPRLAAHNWLFTPPLTRGRFMTTQPCRAKLSNIPGARATRSPQRTTGALAHRPDAPFASRSPSLSRSLSLSLPRSYPCQPGARV